LRTLLAKKLPKKDSRRKLFMFELPGVARLRTLPD